MRLDLDTDPATWPDQMATAFADLDEVSAWTEGDDLVMVGVVRDAARVAAKRLGRRVSVISTVPRGAPGTRAILAFLTDLTEEEQATLDDRFVAAMSKALQNT